MVFTEVSRVFLGILFLPYIQNMVNEEINIKALWKLKEAFDIYEGGQYAVAINVPKDYCLKGFNPKDFPTKGDLKFAYVINDKDKDKIFIGKELVAANHGKEHSEYLLMSPAGNSPLTHLLNMGKDGCVVFYTLISPCINKCLNSEVILEGLKEMQKYNGLKAFVYTNIFDKDKDKKNLREELQKIAERVPLYRCNRKFCIPCGKEVNEECLVP